MPFARPTLTALRSLAVQDITTSGVPGLTGLLRNAVLRVLAWCMAGLAYSVYGYADYIARMGVPFTAEDEFLYAWAALVDVFPKAAAPAHGEAQFTGTPDRILPLRTPLTRGDGVPYETLAEARVDPSGNLLVAIAATVAGAYTNCPPATPIAIARPVSGINSGGETVGETVGGADVEPQHELRNRMLLRYRLPPQGGAQSDYVRWALDVPGVTRAWAVGTGFGAGTVLVYPMLDATSGFPQGEDGAAGDEPRAPAATGDKLVIADHIYPLQPVTALVYVVGALPLAVDVTLAALEPNTEQMRDDIRLSLEDMLLLAGEPGGVVYPSQFYQAILATPGIRHFTMTAPALPVQAPPGHLPVMGELIAPAIV